MGDLVTPEQFRAADGVDDWRVGPGGATARFRTGSFAAGVELVDAVGELADAADHHPDVDLRYPAVTLRLVSHDVGGLSARDVALARQISAAARELDITADPPVEPEVVLDDQGRPEPVIDGDEMTTLLGFLDFHRATLEWKTRGLDAAGLAAALPPTTMTLGGLLKHLAYVEDDWFSRTLHDRGRAEPWRSVDWSADRDWEWHSAADDDPDELRALWRSSVERSRELLASALAAGGPDAPVARSWPDGRAPSVRWVVTHMVEEYARHNGHADLLREAVDGEVGE
ncbi:mycothiol transferase [Cellulomonas sp. Marseille-Q8402]